MAKKNQEACAEIGCGRGGRGNRSTPVASPGQAIEEGGRKMGTDRNPYEIFTHNVEEAARCMGLERVEYEFVKYPERQLKVTIPVQMDDGSTRLFEGYRVQHSTLRGPCKGGVRYHTSVCEEEVQALAGLTTLQCALANVPYGGAYGGVNVDVEQISHSERQRLTRRYTAMILPFIGPNEDILAPDMHTDEEVMGWIMDTYSMMKGHAVQGIVTGKPMDLGGSQGVEEAPARGLTFVTRELLKRMKKPLDLTTAAILGMGKVGAGVSRLMYVEGIRVMAVGDITGGLYCRAGLHIPGVLEHLSQGKLLCEYQEDGVQHISIEELLRLECDILVPAALECQIHGKNAADINAKIIIEGANCPITWKADQILEEKGVVVAPDILANAGGMIVSYFEWVQNIQTLVWDGDEVNRMLRQIIIRAFDDVWVRAQEQHISLRKSAYSLALERVCRAKKIRGIFP